MAAPGRQPLAYIPVPLLLRPQDRDYTGSMPDPYLLFCPYLPLSLDEPVVFTDWELGPLESFKDRWADPRFEERATAFLNKFVGPNNDPINNPALLCKVGKQLDGQKPLDEEVRALELSLIFASVDRNPRKGPDIHEGWGIVTADNAELYAWPIDLEQGRITLSAGYLVTVNIAGYKISDPELVLRPPLDLHMPILAPSPDPLVLTGIYETVLRSLRSPGENSIADRVRVAVEWLAKAWANTRAVQWPERLVYLKTAFEALTGTNKNWKSAKKLREIFEALPHTTERDSAILVWSPEEKPVHHRTWPNKNGRPKCTRITDLEHWFIEFGDARNRIIHEGRTPELTYAGPNPAYAGPFVFTAEFLLRGVIKVLLSELGYENAWRSELWRTIDADLENGLMEHKSQDHPVSVEHRDDEVPCPKCGGKAIKQDYPLRPMPTAPENGEDVTDALGQVFCESCNQTYPWEYRVASCEMAEGNAVSLIGESP